MTKPITNGNISSWLLLLQEFNITILDRPGKENTVADFIFRMKNNNEDVPINDKFHDGYLFAVSNKTPWFAYIANYLATGNIPPQLSAREKQKVIKTSAPYS